MPKLFPGRYMNRGSKGPAVAALQLFLLGTRINRDIVVDGEYGEQTMLAVMELQRTCDIEADGNFGPETRRAVHRRYDLDFDSLEQDLFEGDTDAVTP